MDMQVEKNAELARLPVKPPYIGVKNLNVLIDAIRKTRIFRCRVEKLRSLLPIVMFDPRDVWMKRKKKETKEQMIERLKDKCVEISYHLYQIDKRYDLVIKSSTKVLEALKLLDLFDREDQQEIEEDRAILFCFVSSDFLCRPSPRSFALNMDQETVEEPANHPIIPPPEIDSHDDPNTLVLCLGKTPDMDEEKLQMLMECIEKVKMFEYHGKKLQRLFPVFPFDAWVEKRKLKRDDEIEKLERRLLEIAVIRKDVEKEFRLFHKAAPAAKAALKKLDSLGPQDQFKMRQIRNTNLLYTNFIDRGTESLWAVWTTHNNDMNQKRAATREQHGSPKSKVINLCVAPDIDDAKLQIFMDAFQKFTIFKMQVTKLRRLIPMITFKPWTEPQELEKEEEITNLECRKWRIAKHREDVDRLFQSIRRTGPAAKNLLEQLDSMSLEDQQKIRYIRLQYFLFPHFIDQDTCILWALWTTHNNQLTLEETSISRRLLILKNPGS
ncbi:unnamed protein product [Caenorhabditis auriculariae]|uniref:Uncharacterized protein n=1 Tax=Caenorhabditis auriculariae TaxID=2777116 RepID=A0A8S1H5X1_9PELO|nr:unnamed protein product [Caenorhabditis auriculariae]